jgi:hypothetical protein
MRAEACEKASRAAGTRAKKKAKGLRRSDAGPGARFARAPEKPRSGRVPAAIALPERAVREQAKQERRLAVIHRSQDEMVEAHADRILADDRSAAEVMSYFDAQMRHERKPLRRRFADKWRALQHALASAAVAGGHASGVPTGDPEAQAPTER